MRGSGARVRWYTHSASTSPPDRSAPAVARKTRASIAHRGCVVAGMAPIEKVVFTSQDEVTAALINGEIDAMLADSPVTGFAIKLSRGALEPAGTFDSAPYGWPVAKGSALAESLRQALERLMSTDEYRTIATMWGVEKGMIDKPVINGAMRRSSPYQGLVPRRVAWQ